MIRFLKGAAIVVAVVSATAAAVMLGDDYSRSRVVGAPPSQTGDYPPQSIGNSLLVYTDPATRCEYLRPVGSAGTMVPRMTSDGLRQAGCGTGRQQSIAEFDRR